MCTTPRVMSHLLTIIISAFSSTLSLDLKNDHYCKQLGLDLDVQNPFLIYDVRLALIGMMCLHSLFEVDIRRH